MAMVAAGARGGCGLHERRDLLRRRCQQSTSALLLYVAAARENRGGGQTAGRDREDRQSTSGARTFRHSTCIKHSILTEPDALRDPNNPSRTPIDTPETGAENIGELIRSEVAELGF